VGDENSCPISRINNSMTFSTQMWHQRYQQQARWTKSIRDYLFERVRIQSLNNILELGCGTGVILDEIINLCTNPPYGVDIDHNAISFAHMFAHRSILTLGDALMLPFATHSFDIALCHFVLLWVKNPQQVLEEMTRVVRSGGYLMALAEPDYGGRIDYPTELAQLGRWQTDSLKEQSANPFIGRELRALFTSVGLIDIEFGVLGGQWKGSQTTEDINLEWDIIYSDLNQKKEFNQSVEELKSSYFSSHLNELSTVFVPTFYAIGEVK
jgi:SAM-dependent methyltransferase